MSIPTFGIPAFVLEPLFRYYIFILKLCCYRQAMNLFFLVVGQFRSFKWRSFYRIRPTCGTKGFVRQVKIFIFFIFIKIVWVWNVLLGFNLVDFLSSPFSSIYIVLVASRTTWGGVVLNSTQRLIYFSFKKKTKEKKFPECT